MPLVLDTSKASLKENASVDDGFRFDQHFTSLEEAKENGFALTKKKTRTFHNKSIAPRR